MNIFLHCTWFQSPTWSFILTCMDKSIGPNLLIFKFRCFQSSWIKSNTSPCRFVVLVSWAFSSSAPFIHSGGAEILNQEVIFSRNVCGIIAKCKCLEATGTQTTESYRAWLLTPEVRKSCQRSADSITALKTSSGFNISTKAVCWELHGMGSSCKCPGTFVHVTVSVQLTLVSCEMFP